MICATPEILLFLEETLCASLVADQTSSGKLVRGIYSRRVVAIGGLIWIYFLVVHPTGATERYGRGMGMKLHGAFRWLQKQTKHHP